MSDPTSNLSPRETFPLADVHAPRLERLRNLTRLLDSAIAIPGTSYRIGLDPILGFIPGGGDTIGLLFSSYVVFEAARMGVGKSTLGRMIINVVTDALIGMIPIVGDLFDFFWKSNRSNMKLLEDHLQLPQVSRRRNRRFVGLVMVTLLLAIAVTFVIGFFVLQWVLQMLAIG
jgi:hypothetical protein